MKTGGIIALSLLALTGMGGCSLVAASVGKYNQITKLDVKVDNAQSNINALLQRRSDLLENLAGTAKSYMNAEQKTMIETAQARSGKATQAPIDPATGKPATADALQKSEELRKQVAANQALAAQATQQALMAINQVREAYPDLKADKLMSKMMDELKHTENAISVSRVLYNASVKNYNVARRVFPGNIVASFTGFEEKKGTEIDEDSKKAPKLKFD